MKKLCYFMILFVCLGCSGVYGQQTTDQDTILKPLLQKLYEMLPASATSSSQEMLETVTTRILSEFDTWLECPQCYREKALEECALFPEGRIYSFAIPVLGYANLALKHPHMKAHALEQMTKLIDLLIPVVVSDIHPPQNDLLQLTTYQQEATYLGTLYLALAHYAFIGGDHRYEALHDHLSEILYQAMVKSNGQSLSSYPEYTWHFDTMFVLTALYLDDKRKGLNRTEELIQQHLQWKRQHATHQATGLPEANQSGLPRGCDVSMQICLWAQMAPETAKDLYQKYVKAHWIDHGFIAGFSEWPKGGKSPGATWGDFDSGPIVFDIGLTATGVGLGTTQAMNDQERFEKLSSQLKIVTPTIQTLASMDQNSELLRWFNAFIPLNQTYFTGFLYGDAMLFYALTWVPYPEY
jgi:hypothetical protein